MLYIKMVRNAAGHACAVKAVTGHQTGKGWETRNDWKTMERAEQVAKELNIVAKTRRYIATDAGRYTSPQFDVIEAPWVGQPVSKAFNGDSYPAGVIVKISASLRRIETSTGVVFYRHRQSGAWVSNGTWHMVAGHVSTTNPSF